MGIKVKYDPVGSAGLAAYATGVGQAQERQKKLALGMLMEQGRANRMQQERATDRNFTAGENEKNRAAQGARDKANNFIDLGGGNLVDRDIFKNQNEWDRLDARDQQFRDKDEQGQLYDAIDLREKYMLNTPLNEQGVKQRDEAARSLEWIRRQQAGVRPDAYRQYLGQWVSEFDRRNPQAWEAPPKVQMDGYEYLGVDGKPISHEDAISGRVQIGTMIPPGRNGVPGRPYEVPRPKGFPETSHEFFSEPKNYESAQKEAIGIIDRESLAANEAASAAAGDPAAPGYKAPVYTAPDYGKLGDKMQEVYNQRRGMAMPPTQPTQPGPAGVAPPAQGQRWGGPAGGANAGAQPQPAPAQPTQAPLNAGDPYQQNVQQQFTNRADTQKTDWARGIVQEYQQLYSNIQSLDDIKNPTDRRELEEALKVLEGVR